MFGPRTAAILWRATPSSKTPVATIWRTAVCRVHPGLTTPFEQQRFFGDEKPSRVIKLKAAKRFPKIYTKTGDAGKTSLFTGERRSKDDKVFEALGNTDELSSHLGLIISMAETRQHPYSSQLQRIQCILQDIGSCVATPLDTASEKQLEMVGFSDRHTAELEEWIDEYSADLPPLQNFILPGGGEIASQIHIARSVCRRAERSVIPLVGNGACSHEAMKYLNRLSDFLFTLGRYAGKLDKKNETIYTRPDYRGSSYKPTPVDGVWKKTK